MSGFVAVSLRSATPVKYKKASKATHLTLEQTGPKYKGGRINR